MENNQVIVIVLLGSVLMLTISLTVIVFILQHRKKFLAQLNKMQAIEYENKQQILKAIINAQEEERKQIAHNLHDSVGVELSMIKLSLTQNIHFLKNGNANIKNFDLNAEALDDAIKSMRLVSRNLYPTTLVHFGLLHTFEDLISKMAISTNIKCIVYINISEEDLYPELNSKLNLLRVFQEVLNNIIKYSNCNTLDLQIQKLSNCIHISFQHNGVQFGNKIHDEKIITGNGLGLASIKNRLQIVKGTINYYEQTNGSQIIIELPGTHEKQY